MKKRADGIEIKQDPLFKVIGTIMEERSDAQVYYTQDIKIKYVDEYIKKKREEGISISYMHVIYCALIRLLKEYPNLNRFVMSGRMYQRNEISISLTIKQAMSLDAEESVIKIPFEGNEDILQVKEILDEEIKKTRELSQSTKADEVANTLSKLPTFLVRGVVKVLKYLDTINMMPKSIIKASPFHASAFLTNVGSIGIDSIFHHIYNFGTIGIFVAMGKKKKKLVFEDEILKEEKFISLSIVADERICDGYNFASAMKTFAKYMKNPELLDLPINVSKTEIEETEIEENILEDDIITRFFKNKRAKSKEQSDAKKIKLRKC